MIPSRAGPQDRAEGAARLATAREHGHVGGPIQVGEAFPADGTVIDDPLGHVRSRQTARDPGAVAPVDVGATDEVEGRQVVGQPGERVEEIQRAPRTSALHDVMPRPFGPAGDGYTQSVTDSQQPPGDDGIASGTGASEAQWVSVAQAAQATGASEAWIMDRCRDGRLPHRAAGAPGSSGRDRIVPLATVRALVDGRISE